MSARRRSPLEQWEQEMIDVFCTGCIPEDAACADFYMPVQGYARSTTSNVSAEGTPER